MMKQSKFTISVVCLVALLLSTKLVHAQPKPGYLPSSTHIFPAGGRRGTTVKVRVGAECTPPGTRFSVFGEGVTARTLLGAQLPVSGEPSPRRLPTETPITYPNEWPTEITIAGDAPLGTVSWRISSAQGGTSTRPFVIGELPEFIETESNSTFDTAEQITLPVTVNGQIYGERDSDYFRFAAKAGDVVVCDVMAGRLGSKLDPIVELFDADGGKLNVETAHIGSDPVLAFRVEADGAYVLRISNVKVYGDPAHVYRINISTKPFYRFAFPAGGQAGTKRDVEFFAMTGSGKTRVVKQSVTFPATVSGLQFDINDHANLIEQEPNDSRNTAMTLTLPVTIDGRTLTERDEDWYAFSAAKGQAFSMVCRPYPRGASALPTLQLTDAEGRELKHVLSVQSAERECRLEWKAPQAGTYRLRIRDLQFGAKGGEDFIYRLTVQKARPNFALAIATDCLNVTQGKTSKLNIAVKRTGGFDGPIQLKIDGLPEGVTVDKTEIPAKAGKFTLQLTADADKAVAADSTLRISGTAEIDGKGVTQTARAKHLGVDSEGIAVGSSSLERFHLTVQYKPLFKLFCPEAYLYAHRGSVFLYPMEVERLNGFDGAITLQIGDRQNRDLDGIQMFEVTIPSGKLETFLPIYLPETMHINVQSQSQLYSQAYASFVDQQGQRQSVLVLAEKRNMLRTMPPVVKLQAVDEQVGGKAGEEIACRLHLERTTNFPGSMELVLLEPKAESGFVFKPVTIAAGQTEIEVKVRMEREQVPVKPVVLHFRATGRMANGTQVITEAKVPVRFE